MGESAVLFHSYSFAAPLSHNESHKEKPIHALSQSVSFGRFMTENLEWEKWSSFSHKKYVDEAERFSQPGSVAQKKAFFEAHYKRIADAKKAKALDEESSNSKQQQEPESVEVLPNTLETLTNDELKEEESVETKADETERKSGVVLEQEEVTIVLDELDDKEKHREDGEERRSVTKNSSVLKSTTSEVPDKSMELVFSQKISERPITHSSMKKNEIQVRQRFSFLNCLMGNTKTQDQNTTRKKRKMDKKQDKSFLCLCFKPEMVRETEAPIKTLKKKF